MAHKTLFDHLSSVEPLSASFRQSLKQELTPQMFPQNKILVESNEVCEYCYYLREGFAMSYTYYGGKKIAEAFWKAGQVIVAFKSFFEQTPSDQSIQLMTKSELLGIHYSRVNKLMSIFPDAHRIHSAMMNVHYDNCQDRIRDIQRLNATERLEKLVKDYPGIEQYVSQENIASYLGITPQSLSRLKRDLAMPQPLPRIPKERVA